MADNYSEAAFKSRLSSALGEVRKILDNTRNPQIPETVQHEYKDKYLLAEYLTNSSMASLVNALEVLGLQQDGIKQLMEWSHERSITLRLKAEERCSYLREETRKVESENQHVTEVKSSFTDSTKKYTDKIVTTIVEYFWKFEVQWALFAFKGNDPETIVPLQAYEGFCEIMTSNKNTPRPERTVRPSLDLNITWLFSLINKGSMDFRIDRSAKTCHTPRRNPQVEAARDFFFRLETWVGSVRNYFRNQLFPAQVHKFDLTVLNSASVFCPVQSIFEKRDSGVVPTDTMGPFLAQQRKSLSDKFKDLAATLPPGGVVCSPAGALLVLVEHLHDLYLNYVDGVTYIEDMLRRQLIKAIGKVVSPVDFANYMKFHNRKLFREQYMPGPFNFAVRRPDHFPEGLIGIDSKLHDGSIAEPLFTTVSRSLSDSPMKFDIDSSTTVSFFGQRYLHSAILHSFSGNTGQNLELVARARQFSSFVLLVGKIGGADRFLPKFGIIIQNKDDLKIPLILETIPTPKEFADAIESLSPEQQRFCRAYRQMQLASTLFAVAVIQIKPQLEVLLNLPDDSLTKEIKLTQDLMKLFLEYQIPGDLVTYKGQANDPPEAKIAFIKAQVAKMFAFLEEIKEEELKEQQRKYDLELGPMANTMSFAPASMVYSSVPSPMPYQSMSAPTPMRSYSSGPVPAPPAPVSAPAPAPAPAPRPAQAQAQAQAQAPVQAQQAQAKEPKAQLQGRADPVPSAAGRDYTQLPAQLDQLFLALDEDAQLRPSILAAGKAWTKRYKKGLLLDPTTISMQKKEHREAKQQAFDLLDALSRSGSLAIQQAELHVVIVSTHCFDKTLLETVIQDNQNPIEKVERSTLIVASAIHQLPAVELVNPEELERVKTYSPGLFQE